MEKVFITGGAGFLGSNIAKQLIRQGFDVYASYHKNKPEYPIAGVNYVPLDLLDGRQCSEAMEGIDIVVMCAAYVGGIALMQENPLGLINDSTRININTLEAAYHAGVKKGIFISSGAVYPPLDEKAEEDSAFTGDPIEKYYVLGWAKRFGEVLCQMYCRNVKNAMDITVLRIDNVYGPYDSFEGTKAHVLPSLIRKVVHHDNPVVMWGDGEEKKDFIYVEDLAKAVWMCIENCGGYHVYNVVSGKNITLNEALHEIMDITGETDRIVEHDLSKPASVSERNLDAAKIARELGFQAETDIREGLHKTVEWYMEHYNQKKESL